MRESRDDRYRVLLRAATELDGDAEKRAYLEAACEGEPALLEDLLHTVTLMDATAAGTGRSQHSLVGQIVADRFEVLRELGEGGMAVVYEAMDRKLMERRALKFPKAGHSQTMPPEARSAMRVTHANICRIHEIHTAATDSGPADFISMEMVEGETLHSRWKREHLSLEEAIEIARQLCRGLDAAHKADILHRDLKSNNVMLAPRKDGGLRVVIMDFGLARAHDSGERPDSSSVSGTPNYIAPERWKGAPATPASDLYALGVIFHEMITGSVPFPRGTPWQKRLSEIPASPSQSERKPDPRWDAIVLRLLDPHAGKRFSSSSEVLTAIEQTFRVSHRNKWLAAGAVAALVLSSVVAYRDTIWPAPPLARLAILPFTGSVGTPAADEAVRGGLYELAAQLESLVAKSQRLVVIPVEDSIRHDVNSAARAAKRLGATHVFSGSVVPRGDGLVVRAAVTDAKNGDTLREFNGEFKSSDLAVLSTSLSGVVTSAFHMSKAPPASILPAAYSDYAAGLENLRRSASGFEQAIGPLQRALQFDARSPLIHGALGEAYLQKFRATRDAVWLKEASLSARRAESLQPDSPAVIALLGSIESAEGRPERAIELLRRAAELEPNNSEAWRRIGLSYQQMGRDSEAVAATRKAIQFAPDYYSPHLSLGILHFRAGRYLEAVEAFRRVTRLAPELAYGYSMLGGALLAAEQEAEAEQALRKSVQLRETRAALNNLGVLLRYQHRDEEATQMLTRALRAGADDAGLRLNLANALRSTGRQAEASEHYKRASDLSRTALLRDPRDAAARARLAYTMVHLGTPALAGDEALQAAKLAPSDYSVLFWSIMTLESLGRREDALSLLHNSPAQRLRDLSRQPDLVALSRDPRFRAMLPPAHSTTKK